MRNWGEAQAEGSVGYSSLSSAVSTPVGSISVSGTEVNGMLVSGPVASWAQ